MNIHPESDPCDEMSTVAQALRVITRNSVRYNVANERSIWDRVADMLGETVDEAKRKSYFYGYGGMR